MLVVVYVFVCLTCETPSKLGREKGEANKREEELKDRIKLVENEIDALQDQLPTAVADAVAALPSEQRVSATSVSETVRVVTVSALARAKVNAVKRFHAALSEAPVGETSTDAKKETTVAPPVAPLGADGKPVDTRMY